jgi:hypothetical protein
MEQRIYHGQINPQILAESLFGFFHRGNYHVQKFGEGDVITVQIATQPFNQSGGQTALGVSIQKVEDGVSVSLGQQAWYGVAASIGMTELGAIRNPFSLLGRLDDLAQDIESIQLHEEIWKVIDDTARTLGSGYDISSRLKRMVCDYCTTANPAGEPHCIACGAPLGNVQPISCKFCGYIVNKQERNCPNCGKLL